MLATIRDFSGLRFVKFALFLAVAMDLASCASKEPGPLIADPSAAHETALPWNEQQKWEREGQGSMLNQQRR